MAVRVRDASVHPFVLVHATAEAARRHGADIRTHCDVAGMIRDGTRVHGVEVRDALRGETYLVHADIVVNAAGPWAGKVAALAGIDIPVRPNAGALAVLGVRVVGMTVHRCRPPSDGDIVVPLGKTAILGTTSRAIDDPDNVVVHEWEKDGLMGPAAEVVPGVRHAPLLRMFAGARPLFSRGEQDGRQASRGFAVLDHGQRDGVRGFLSVVGGKLTIHRLMAERTADVVCGYLGVGAECRTAIEPLPPIPAALEASVPEDNPLRLA
jgi:glycerol-3-phosphate dehydrogenase